MPYRFEFATHVGHRRRQRTVLGGDRDHDLGVVRTLDDFVLLGEDLRTDFDEIAVQLRLVPFGENVVQFIRRGPDAVFQQLVGFANQLDRGDFDSDLFAVDATGDFLRT